MRHIVLDERGQATAEYALVIVAAAAIALALIIWATSTDLLPSFFTTVLRKVTSVAEGAPIG
jgi:Flp pilus assembly pilin Flp